MKPFFFLNLHVVSCNGDIFEISHAAGQKNNVPVVLLYSPMSGADVIFLSNLYQVPGTYVMSCFDRQELAHYLGRSSWRNATSHRPFLIQSDMSVENGLFRLIF